MTSPLTPNAPLTYEEYRLLPEDGLRYEVMDGELFVSLAPSTRHQTVSRRLLFALMQALEQQGLAQIFNAPVDLILEPKSVVQPDLAIVSASRAWIVTDRALDGGVPDVVIEILSPQGAERDERIKRRVYERHSIPEYWIVDPEHEVITTWCLESGSYALRARWDRSSTLTHPDFPQLRVTLADIFK